jgi:hypothetical protein
LDILADTCIAVKEEKIETKTNRKWLLDHGQAPILARYKKASPVEGDRTGEETYVAMTFHPKATAAILHHKVIWQNFIETASPEELRHAANNLRAKGKSDCPYDLEHLADVREREGWGISGST